ncbi:MAG: MASE1 domain-containing protein [Myxococcales bacterium]
MTPAVANARVVPVFGLRQLAVLACVALAYLLAARFGLSLAFATKQVTAVWPPTGIAVAAVWLWGYRVWPALFVGALLANATAGEGLATATGIALGNTAAPLFGVWLMRTFTRFQGRFDSVRDVGALVAFGAGLGMMVSATNGALQLAWSGLISWSAFTSVWWVWWVGDAMGVLLLTPFFLLCAAPSPRPGEARRWGELLVLALLLASALLLFATGIFYHGPTGYHLQYAVFPFVIWAALRFGPREAASATLMVCGVAVWATIHGRGPFGAAALWPEQRLLLLETFMAVVAVTGLTLAALTEERRRAERALRLANDELELRVNARTRELGASNGQLAQKNAALRESEARFRTLFAESPLSLWEEDFSAVRNYLDGLQAGGVTDLPGHLRQNPEAVLAAAQLIRVIAVNQATLTLYGADSYEQFLTQLPSTFGPDALATFCDELCAFASGQTQFAAETTTVTINGNVNNISVRVNIIPGCEQTWSRVVVSIYDLTAHKEKKRRLLESLREKEVLLSEVHHRVKNNLQIVSSLLNLQAGQLADPVARQVFAETQSRIQAIALVHEKLYQSDSLSAFSFRDYLSELVTALDRAQNGGGRGIALRVECDDLELSVDYAITCGLIVNELTTNALKHAFPAGRHGGIAIAVRRLDSASIELSVSDDGVGLPESVDALRTRSVGLSLVVGLARQLGASLQVIREGGTRFAVAFSPGES